MPLSFLTSLRYQFPGYCEWLRKLGLGRQNCLICNDKEDGYFIHCPTFKCKATYCRQCWIDVNVSWMRSPTYLLSISAGILILLLGMGLGIYVAPLKEKRKEQCRTLLSRRVHRSISTSMHTHIHAYIHACIYTHTFVHTYM